MTNTRFPFTSSPKGWYCVGYSDELAVGDVKSIHYFEKQLVMWRGEDGQVRMLDAYCPHMGAHLGRGEVRGEHLRCPFHGFCFDADGICVATPYESRIPAAARLDKLLVEPDLRDAGACVCFCLCFSLCVGT